MRLMRPARPSRRFVAVALALLAFAAAPAHGQEPPVPPPPPPPPGAEPGIRAGPALIAAPRIAGRARVGARLVARPGRWSGASLKRSYQWLRCHPPAGACSVIPQARRASYRPTRADVGFMLRVVETAANGTGRATAASRPSVRVRAG
jgi:hypothetical protein